MKNKKDDVVGISTAIIKTLADFLAEPLSHIVNLCFIKGEWPKVLKCAEIVLHYALNFIIDKILLKLDNSTSIGITFLDLGKAFDTVNYEILLKKLYNYGIRGNAYYLITSHLGERLQMVRVNGIYSEVNVGVPQGTILGPLLFILYVNYLLINTPEGQIVSFADDTGVITEESDWNKVEVKINFQLQEVSEWLALNNLSLNIHS